jgi:hypothetical protein
MNGRTTRPHAGGAGDEQWVSTDALIERLVELGPVHLASGDRQSAEQAATRLGSCPRPAVLRALENEVIRAIDRLFRAGWQPAEVMRQARRDGGATHAALTATAIVAMHERWSADVIDPRWQEQIDVIRATAVDGGGVGVHGWLAGWSLAAGSDRRSELMAAFEVLATLRSLPPLEELIPPPGSRGADRPRRATSDLSDDDRRLLDRVRHLLGKAESTEFEAEAEAFTAKAHEPITRHAIDMALLAGTTGHADDERPTSTRVDIDDPYADAKSLLLQIVAGSNRCRTVYHSRLAISTVLGFPADLAATELLFTSLLVQGQAALAVAGRSAPPGARTRSRSYRSAFLVAYANRIGQRLAEINDHLVTDVGGSSALPVLRSREAAVDDAVAARFPELTSSAVRAGYDTAGWAGGRLAADRARLNLADLADGPRGGGGGLEPTALASGQ